MEALTDELEEAAWKEVEKIDKMGGATAAVEYMHRETAKSAYERQKRIEKGEDLIVGVNCFTGENELEVSVRRVVEHPYDPDKREEAEQKQIARLAEVKRTREDKDVARSLSKLETEARKSEVNLMPYIIECVKCYATVQEICDTLKSVFGEYEPGEV